MSRSRSNRADTPAQVASGVEELITRLREQGVAAGRTEADRLIAEARAEAQQRP